MLPVRCYPLGGEGCPAADVADTAKNRKSRSADLAGLNRFKRERVGNGQKNWHTGDTALFGKGSTP